MLASPVTLFVNPFPSGLLYVSGHDYKSFYNLLTQLSYQRSYRSAFYTLYYQNSSHCWLFGSKPQIKNPFGCRSVRRITASGYRFVIFQLQNDNLATGIITLPNKHFPKKWLLLKSEPATENNLPSSAWQLHPSSGVWFIVLFTRGHVWVSATHWFTQNDSTHSLQDPSYPRTCEASSSLFLLVFSCCADLYFDGWSVFPVASFTYFCDVFQSCLYRGIQTVSSRVTWSVSLIDTRSLLALFIAVFATATVLLFVGAAAALKHVERSERPPVWISGWESSLH